MSDYIDDVFGANGILAKSDLRAAVRPGQIEMARAVDHSLRARANMMCEAGTGTGKTFAYLVPAIANQLVTIVVTRNNLLADQLYLKDLPTLHRLLPWKFTFAQIKGKGRYLCVAKFPGLPGSSPPPLQRYDDADVDAEIQRWAPTTRTGDFSELSFTIPDRLLHRYTANQDECERRKCPAFQSCHYYAAKRNAAVAQVVVTNYHVFFSHLRYGRVLPDYDVVIMDEGHDAPDIARDFFGFRVTAGAVRRIAGLVGRASKASGDAAAALKNELIDSANTLFADLAAYQAIERGIRIRKPIAVEYTGTVRLLRDAASQLKDEADELAVEDPPGRQELLRHSRRASELARQITEAVNLSKHESFIYQIDGDRADLVSRAINPAEFLARHLNVGPAPDTEESSAAENDDGVYDDQPADETPEPHAHVMTSATITTPTLGGAPSFEFVRTTMGIKETGVCLAESPFQLDRQCLLIIPWEAPRPPEGRLSPATRAERMKGWHAGVASMVVKVAERARGRTLALFTSNASLNASYDALVRAGLPYQILRQGGGTPNAKLVEAFKRDVNSVLLGVDSFWQGIDVPGESLSCVVIDKLPYKHSGIDPILDAIEERDGRDRAFTEYNLPRTIIQFRQAFGRLIRSEADKGVVVMLDPRVIERNRAQFLGALPGVRLSQDLGDIPCFLDGAAPIPFVLPPPPRVGIR